MQKRSEGQVSSGSGRGIDSNSGKREQLLVLLLLHQLLCLCPSALVGNASLLAALVCVCVCEVEAHTHTVTETRKI